MVRDVSVILLFNDEGEVLLQQRSLDAKRAPGKWGFFGGGIEKRFVSQNHEKNKRKLFKIKKMKINYNEKSSFSESNDYIFLVHKILFTYNSYEINSMTCDCGFIESYNSSESISLPFLYDTSCCSDSQSLISFLQQLIIILMPGILFALYSKYKN